ncbi:MAG TPA: phosphopantetheine-binding protein [Mycobacteriales bacterium]|jgi:aryl carrier-like protein|nr:phosphopantetheine-binding protein [Mycobacteriales bacterium]
MPEPPPTGRQLLASLLDDPSLIEVADDEDLLAAGLNSGDIIRLALAIEELTGEALDDKALSRLYTVDGLDEVLAERLPGTADRSG